MPSTPASLKGAALIAPAYHIVIKVLDSTSNKYFTNVNAISNPHSPPAPRAHRGAGTAVNDWVHEHLTCNSDPNRGMKLRPRLKCELEQEMECEDDEVAREIRNLAEQKGERVLDKREALAMASLCRHARGVVGM
jgi:hypothetical protein